MALPAIKSPPTNCFGLVQFISQRLPGYDPSEPLRELNSATIHVWEEITKLRNNYYTAIKTVSTVAAQFNYDLTYNSDGGLSAAISPKLYQITKVRFQPPNGQLFQGSTAMAPNDPDFVSLNANASSPPAQTGPYNWFLSGTTSTILNLALPLAIGTKIEVTYTFWPLQLVFLTNGTVTSNGATVTGTGTNFTSILQPDFQFALPTIGAQEEVPVELVCNPNVPTGGQVYRVISIASDTTLTTAVPISPALASSSIYALATLPSIPREHIRVAASIALAAMYSVAGDDQRVSEWTAKSTANMQMMKDALMERQNQNPARKIRFPGSIAGARNRAFLR